MADHVKAAATAKRLIEANGRTVTLFKLNRTATNSAKKWRGTTTAPATASGGLTADVTVAFLPASGSGFGKMIVDNGGSLAVSFDQVALLASDSLPTGTTPEDVEKMDQVRDGSAVWKIVTRGHLKPGGTSIMFVLGVKK